mgnify:FL=1
MKRQNFNPYKEQWSSLSSYARRPKIYVRESWYGGDKYHTFKSVVGVTGKSRVSVERDAIGRIILYQKRNSYPYFEKVGRFPEEVVKGFYKDY